MSTVLHTTGNQGKRKGGDDDDKKKEGDEQRDEGAGPMAGDYNLQESGIGFGEGHPDEEDKS